MKIKKGTEKEYAVFRAERTLEPDYRATLLYMESWAEAMEQELEKGATIEEAVLKTRFQNAEAITLRGYRWALRLLCYVWEYGEELKQWQRCGNIDSYPSQNRPPGLNNINPPRGGMRL